MTYYIKFGTTGAMWDFIESKIKSDYAANNEDAILTLSDYQHGKAATLSLASRYGGKEVIPAMPAPASMRNEDAYHEMPDDRELTNYK
jgi:hypothetical protein